MSWNGKERRRSVRRDIPCTIYVTTPGEQIIYSSTEDISEVGVRVNLDVKLEIKARVYVEIYIEDEPIFCKAEVVWVKEIDDESGKKIYSTGIEIISRENV